MQIALDLENVVAHVHPLTIENSDTLTTEDHMQKWYFDDEEVFDHFMDVTAEVWSDQTLDIPPQETIMKERVALLQDIGSVDLVTNRHGVDDSIHEWIEHNEIPVNDIVINQQGTPKQDFDYDVYIDDNPHLAGEVDRLYLYDQPWNQPKSIFDAGECMHITEIDERPDADLPEVVRVESLRDVIIDLQLNEP